MSTQRQKRKHTGVDDEVSVTVVGAGTGEVITKLRMPGLATIKEVKHFLRAVEGVPRNMFCQRLLAAQGHTPLDDSAVLESLLAADSSDDPRAGVTLELVKLAYVDDPEAERRLMEGIHRNPYELEQMLRQPVRPDAIFKPDHGRAPWIHGFHSGPFMVALVRLYLEAGADVNQTEGIDEWFHPARLGMFHACPEMARLLWEFGADVNIAGDSRQPDHRPIFEAATQGDTHIVRALCDLRADVNVMCKTYDMPLDAKCTPLYAACAFGHVETVRYLLTARANPDAANGSGHTPWMKATVQGYDEIVQLLLEAGADVNKGKENGLPSHRKRTNGAGAGERNIHIYCEHRFI